MAFSFQNYGTFSGPGAQYKFRENDDFTNIFEDPTFNLDDVSMVLLSTPSDYVYLHLDGTSTANVTLERNTGPITQFFVDATTSYFNGSVAIDQNLNVLGTLNIVGSVAAPTFVGNLTGVASGNKVLPFDIPHVTQKGKRIRHIIAEGPEAGIYVRGKIKDTNVIELPEYWDGLVDPETITVTLTQIGYSQDLIVDKINLDKNIIIRSGSGTNIHCYYEIWASRWINPMNHDEKLIVVYDGETPDDYPGDNKQFLIGGWDYDRRNPYWEPLDRTSSVVL